MLMIVDHFTGENIATELEQRLKGKNVAPVLVRIGNHRRFPKTIRVDNGLNLLRRH